MITARGSAAEGLDAGRQAQGAVRAEGEGNDSAPRFVIIIPVYNHAARFTGVLSSVRQDFPEYPLILVDDGSTDESAALISAAAQGNQEKPEGPARIYVVRHARNRGKGRALQSGFARALELGCTHAITIDADGQHHVPDVHRLITFARAHPWDLIIGNRDMSGGNVPAKSITGKDLSRFWLRLQTGQDIPDSQCGLRIYPLEAVTVLRHRFNRFDFETETLCRLAWAVVVRSVPVKCIYFAGAERVTHFRPIRDTVRGTWLNIYMAMRRLLPVPTAKLVRHHETALAYEKPNWFKWQTWRHEVRTLLCANSSNAELAAAVGVGVLCGILPVYGFQTLLALYAARRLHLNLGAAILGNQISIPPLQLLWLYISLEVGNLVLHGRVVHFSGDELHQMARMDHLLPHLLAAAVGSVIVGCVVAAGCLMLTRKLLKAFRGNLPVVYHYS